MTQRNQAQDIPVVWLSFGFWRADCRCRCYGRGPDCDAMNRDHDVYRQPPKRLWSRKDEEKGMGEEE